MSSELGWLVTWDAGDIDDACDQGTRCRTLERAEYEAREMAKESGSSVKIWKVTEVAYYTGKQAA